MKKGTEKKKTNFCFLMGIMKSGLFIYIVGSILRSMQGLLGYMLNGQVYRIVLRVGNGLPYMEMLRGMGALIGGLILTASLVLLGEVLVIKEGLKTDRCLRQLLVHQICRMPEKIRAGQAIGYWTSLFGRDMDAAGESYKIKWGDMLSRLLTIIGGFAILAFYNLPMSIFCIFCGLLYFILIYVMKSKVKLIQQKIAASLEKCNRLLGEITLGLPIIRFYQMGERFGIAYKKAVDENAGIGMRNVRISTVAMGFRSFGYSFSYIGILIFGLVQVNRDILAMDDLMYLWPIGVGIAYSIQSLGFQLLDYQASEVAVSRVKESCELPIERGGSLQVSGNDILFEHVFFEYSDNKQILKDISLSIQKGQKVAIVGASGGGKTTIIRLLMNLYQPTSGCIKVGGIVTTEADLRELRNHFAYLPQMPFLFDDSLKENLRLVSPVATDERIRQVSDEAGLRALIEKLPDGFETIVGENGTKLSGGERQRVGVARCYLKDADIFLMDEMTSALDAKLEEEVLRNLFAMEEKTVICVTHRLAAARMAERILVLDQGRIAEDGDHEGLMQKQGIYYQLVQANDGL